MLQKDTNSMGNHSWQSRLISFTSPGARNLNFTSFFKLSGLVCDICHGRVKFKADMVCSSTPSESLELKNQRKVQVWLTDCLFITSTTSIHITTMLSRHWKGKCTWSWAKLCTLTTSSHHNVGLSVRKWTSWILTLDYLKLKPCLLRESHLKSSI